MKRTISYSIAIISLSLFLFSACQSGNKEDNKPNIIYILADDMGYGDVSSLNPDSKRWNTSFLMV